MTIKEIFDQRAVRVPKRKNSERFNFNRMDVYVQRLVTADEIAAQNLSVAMKNPAFKEFYLEYHSLPYRLANAERSGDTLKIVELETVKSALERKMRVILKSFKLTPEDLKAKRICKICSDTGWTGEGTLCDCWEVEYERKKEV